MNDHIKDLPLNLSDLVNELNSILLEGRKMIIIAAKCSSLFDGRIKSEVGESDRILIIKKDGSILLHGSEGTKPEQWQKKKLGPIKFIQRNNNIIMESYRPRTDESFFITLSKIHKALIYNAHSSLEEKSSVVGDEKDFVDFLVQNPKAIEEGLVILERERNLDLGFIDIIARDKNGLLVIVEVKKQNATPADAYQLERYVKDYRERMGKESIRGILVANNFPVKIKQYLKAQGLEACKIPWQKIFPTVKRPIDLNRVQSLEDFFE